MYNQKIKNIDLALKYYKLAADQKYALAFGALARYYYFDQNDYVIGMNYLDEGIALNDSYSYYLKGFVYHYGKGQKVDLALAKYYYEKASSLGSKEAKKEIVKL